MSPEPEGKEKTFRSYTSDQAQLYATHRLNYHQSVYDTILQHTSHHGTLLDVGCGPGLAAHTLAPHFSTTIGIDPSEGMIASATSTPSNIRFAVSTAEELGSNLDPPIQDGSIDLITASNAAHWFDMPRFWKAAARVLKPGGSVALWTSGEITVHPSVPNAKRIQKDWDDMIQEHLLPYYKPGNFLVRDCYRGLQMPADCGVSGFETHIIRRDWGADEEFFVATEGNLDMLEMALKTASPYTRWKEAHPDHQGERDFTRMMRRMMEKHLHEAGVTSGEERVRGAVPGALIIVKKSA